MEPRHARAGRPHPESGAPTTLSLTVPAAVEVARKAGLEKGIAYTAACTPGCNLTGKLSVDAKTAKKLHLSAAVRKAIGSATLEFTRAGSGKLVVKLSKGAKAALSKARNVTLLLTTTAADLAGDKVAKTTKVTLV